MFPFTFLKAADESEALAAGAAGARYIAGGTTLVDLMRETVERPTAVVDINALPYHDITFDSHTVRVGSLVRMTDLARHQRIRAQYPVVSQALELSASAQLRNMASIGGNLLQRPRCTYFRDVTAACNRREPGAGCGAIEGVNRTQAVLGASSSCVATHPSDLAVALTALDSAVVLRSRDGERRLPLSQFFRLPGDTPERLHNLLPGELIAAIEIPAAPYTHRSGYLKVRDRQSYEFALVSAAVALHIEGGIIRDARVAAGGVGTVPWRLPQVEAALIGKQPSPELWEGAVTLAPQGAKALSQNSFKIELMKRAIARELATVGAEHD